MKEIYDLSGRKYKGVILRKLKEFQDNTEKEFIILSRNLREAEIIRESQINSRTEKFN